MIKIIYNMSTLHAHVTVRFMETAIVHLLATEFTSKW